MEKKPEESNPRKLPPSAESSGPWSGLSAGAPRCGHSKDTLRRKRNHSFNRSNKWISNGKQKWEVKNRQFLQRWDPLMRNSSREVQKFQIFRVIASWNTVIKKKTGLQGSFMGQPYSRSQHGSESSRLTEKKWCETQWPPPFYSQTSNLWIISSPWPFQHSFKPHHTHQNKILWHDDFLGTMGRKCKKGLR